MMAQECHAGKGACQAELLPCASKDINLPAPSDEIHVNGRTICNLGNHTTLFALYATLRKRETFNTPALQQGGSVLLDSSLINEQGRYSIAGFLPSLVLEETDGICWENGLLCALPLEERLSELLAQKHQQNPTALPLLGGALGFFAYDFGRKFEHIISQHPRTTQLPDARFCFYDLLLIEDHATGMIYGVAEDKTPACYLFDEVASIASSTTPVSIPQKHQQQASYKANFTQSEYEQTLRRMIDYIAAGHIYVANMTQCLEVDSLAHPFDAYTYLRHHNPAPFSAFMEYPEGQVACASMERFCQVRSGILETRPIKGTRPRGQTEEEDAAYRQELEDSEKDHSELLMIVDLERNDLNRICIPGTVQVTDHFGVEEYATVFHLVSTIQGKLAKDVNVALLVQALFPGGSITGAPKIRAMEIIDELEHGRRGLYTGSIGYFGLDGDCDLNIVIRTAVWDGNGCHVGVGGGITYESDTAFEYEETLQKAKAVLEALA